MTTFRSNLGLASIGLVLLGLAVWGMRQNLKHQSGTFGGMRVRRDSHPRAFALLIGFYVLIILMIILVLLDLLFGFDLRVWL